MTTLIPRGVTGLLLAALLFVGPLTEADPTRPLLVDSETPIDEVARVLTVAPTVQLTYEAARPPSGALSAVLASANAVTLRTPSDLPLLEVEAPRDAMAGRRTSLALTVRGNPGTTRAVTLESTGGIVDTVSIAIGADGETRLRIGVEPARAGAVSWLARSDGPEATARVWVRPASPVRVLALTGPPGLESRHLVRALESAGAEVDVRTDLGRDLEVSTDAGFLPESLDDLVDVDVVVLVEPVTAPLALLTRWVEEAGGGLLRVTQTSPGPGSTGSLTWSGPPELVPLPDADVQASGQGRLLWPEAAHAITSDVVRSEVGDRLAVAGWLGRGRVYASTLSTWPWVMEHGQTVEHRRHWQSVVEWLAGGLRDDHALDPGPAVAGVAWTGRIDGVAPLAGPLTLRSPDATSGSTSALLHPDRDLLRALPTESGAYTLHDAATPDAPARFGFVAAPADAPLTWAEAALVIGGEGGAIVPASSDQDGGIAGARPLRSSTMPRALLFLALAALSGGAWTARRVTGLA